MPSSGRFCRTTARSPGAGLRRERAAEVLPHAAGEQAAEFAEHPSRAADRIRRVANRQRGELARKVDWADARDNTPRAATVLSSCVASVDRDVERRGRRAKRRAGVPSRMRFYSVEVVRAAVRPMQSHAIPHAMRMYMCLRPLRKG